MYARNEVMVTKRRYLSGSLVARSDGSRVCARWNPLWSFCEKPRLQDFLHSTMMLGTCLPTTLKSSPELKLSASAAKLRLLKKLRCTLRYEKLAWESGACLVAGVDEVGRGSLFGPVVAAAVILERGYRVRGLRDSKLLLAERREILAERIRDHAVAWAVAAVDAARIDQINIYQASRVAMRDAVMQLAPAADYLLVDAMRIDCDVQQKPIIHGDALSASIAAASILAKVYRDQMMREWDPIFPAYGLASHKGYSTPKHLAALREFGPTPLHRQSFAPVWQNPVPQEVFEFMEEDTAASVPPGLMESSQ
jgi:ribonuclease HII